MHPTVGYALNQVHLADLRHQAQHHGLARATRQARSARPHRPGDPSPNPAGLARKVLATLATRST
jgi:hypothetical protein